MKKSKIIIGREREQEILQSYCDSDKSELVAIYGRRRVGKTYLIKQFFGEHFDFFFTGTYEATKEQQLFQFQKELENYSGKEIPKIDNWFDAFSLLKDYLISLEKEKIIVFLDELPWMDSQKSNFIKAFSYFWNMWSSKNGQLKLFVCGSATTWMLEKLIGDKGGLYGRVSRAIYLSPFSLGETEKFLKSIKHIEMNRHQILELYMILGGIPYYLDMIKKEIPLSKNIDALLFEQGAPLKSEYSFLFRSLFKDSQAYKKVIEALSTKLKGMTRSEIIEATKIKEGGTLTEILKNLCACDFIRNYSAFGKTERDTIYQLTDLFSLFHLRFVNNNSGQDENFWSNMANSAEKRSWSGYAFEQACLHHIRQIKNALGIQGVLSNAYSWSCKPFTDKNGTEWKGGQIDLVIDRKDEVINLCEMKYTSDEFMITKDYEKKLRNRTELFRTTTKTKKALNIVFITTYGVKQNAYKGIVQNEVTSEDLFKLL